VPARGRDHQPVRGGRGGPTRPGEWIIDMHLPAPGTPTQPVEAGYMANAWARLRHPDFDTLRSILDDLGERIQVRAE